MSEERFIVIEEGVEREDTVIEDTITKERYNEYGVVELLNEQQELIEELHSSDHMGWGRAEKFEKELKQKKIYIKRLEYKVQKFKEMNSEQQDTIRKLQDLCGKSDYENAKLREEVNLLRPTNLEQYEQIQKLQEENEQLKSELHMRKMSATIDLMSRK